MRFKRYFDYKERTQMEGVWKEVYNVFIDLRDWSYAHIDENGHEWFDLKLNSFLFLNLVRELYERLNQPNSRGLVKPLHEELSRSNIALKGLQEIGDKYGAIWACGIQEYERNIIFGGLYYVLRKQQAALLEQGVPEKVKEIVCSRGISHLHYFYYFEELLLATPALSAQPAQELLEKAEEECKKADELPSLFCLDLHAASAIESKIREAVNINSKTQACVNLYALQQEGYINLNQYASDDERARVLNQHQDRHIFNADDVQRGRVKSL